MQKIPVVTLPAPRPFTILSDFSATRPQIHGQLFGDDLFIRIQTPTQHFTRSVKSKVVQPRIAAEEEVSPTGGIVHSVNYLPLRRLKIILEELLLVTLGTSEKIQVHSSLCLGNTKLHAFSRFVSGHIKDLFSLGTATTGSDVVNLDVNFRLLFPTFVAEYRQELGECCLPNGQAFVAYPNRPMTLHRPTKNSLAVLNHKILEANSQVQNVKLGGHQTCLSINRLWHELCDMLRRLVGTTAPGHDDCSIQE
ncbi:uncharacterized protein TNCV_4726131 [Trichonephila clavipes]|nr:uncharacterized protein TNCV_4726131 [Trichonephila clavipes]